MSFFPRAILLPFIVMMTGDLFNSWTSDSRNYEKSVYLRIQSHADIGDDFVMTSTGTPGDISFGALRPAIAYNASAHRYLVVWEQNISGESEIWGQLLDDEGAGAGAAFAISDTPGDANFDALAPDVAASDDVFLVVWNADRDEGGLINDEMEIYCQLVTLDGDLQFSSDKRISSMGTDGSNAYNATAPSVVYNGTQNEFLVVWTGNDDLVTGSEIYAQRITEAGAEIGTDDQKITDLGASDASVSFNALAPDVAWNDVDNQYLVVWHGDDATDNEFEIYGQRLAGSNAAPIGSNDFRISTMGPNGNISYNAFNPSVAFNAASSRYLVVWNGDHDAGGVVDNENEIYGQLLTNLGVDSGSDFRISDLGPDGNANFDAFFPNVEADPMLNQFLVTWHGDDNTAPLVDNEVEIFGQILSGTGVESGINDFRLSNAGTSGNTTFAAQNVAHVYNPSMREFLVVFEADADINSEFEIWGHRHAELSTPPGNQPTSPGASSITASSFTVSFSAASGSPDGYIVLRRSGSSPTNVPANHHVYQAGDFIGEDEVVFVGAGLTFPQSGLSANTSYYYDIFSYNGVASATNYLTTTPLQFNATTLASQPGTQARNIVVKSLTQTSVTFNFTKGNGGSRLVVGRQQNAVNDFPDDATSYTANANFTLAPDIGSGNRVVAIRTGSDNSDITVTNLNAATSYHFRVFEFNGSGSLTNYNTATATGNPAEIFTLSAEPANQPTSLSFMIPASTSVQGTFSAATGTPDGYLVIRRAGSAPTGKPVDGKLYASGDTVGSGGNAIVVTRGSSLSFNSTGLSPVTTYHFKVFSYNGNDGSINYRVINPLSGNATTLATEPVQLPSALGFSNVSSSSMDISFQASADNPDGYLVLRKANTAPTGKPIDAKIYQPGDTVGTGGDATVVFVGNNTSAPSTGLQETTLYHYTVFPYNGSGVSTNYLTSTPLTGSRTTYAAEPESQPAGLSFQSIATSSMNGSITPAAAGADGYLVLRKEASAPTEEPVDGTALTVGSSFGTGTVVHAGSSTTFSNTGLNAGTVYHYKVFAFNGSGSTINYILDSPLTSDAITLCNAPEALDPVQFGTTSFTARWNASGGASHYELDVFLADQPAVFVDGYQSREVTSGLEEVVVGLAPGTSYKYRVRAVNASGASANSLEKTATTTQTTTFQIDPPVFNGKFSAGSAVTVEVRGATTPTVTMRARPIAGEELLPVAATLKDGSSTTYEVTLTDAMADELGMEFFFQADNGVQVIANPTHYFMYRSVDASSNQFIPFATTLDGKTRTYQMFSIPYQLQDDDIADLFETALNGHDPVRWRMFQYQNGNYQEYPGQFRKLAPGRAYWFNTIEKDFQIRITAADVVKANQDDPFEITLQAGWNQIGNPYPFDILWSEVAGGNDKLGSLWFYKNGSYAKSDVFEPWSGAFVHADEALTLSIPVTAKSASPGRIKGLEMSADLDGGQWVLPITLKIGDQEQVSGVGMHPDAVQSKDRFDEITVPRFLDYAEMNTYHAEFFSPRFSTDVVPTSSEYVWTFDVHSNQEEHEGRLTWDHISLASNGSALILIDLLDGKWVDMKREGSYSFTHKRGRQFRIAYSREGEVRPGVSLLGSAYPNPFTTRLAIPVLVDEPGYKSIEIYDSFGRRVAVIGEHFHTSGAHEIEWQVDSDPDLRPVRGLYYYRLAGSSQGVKRVVRN